MKGNPKTGPDPDPAAKVARRAFMGRMGAFGLGAIGASTLLAACGSDNPGTRQSGAGSLAQFSNLFGEIRQDEVNHVTFLVQAITANGGTPRPEPTFPTANSAWNPPDANAFVQLADALENTGTGAYLYAAQNQVLRTFQNGAILLAAASIALVEGRHAGFLNAITGRPLLTDPRVPGDHTTPPTPPNYSMDVPEPPSLVYQRAAPFVGTVVAGSAPASGADTTGTTYLNGGPAPPSDNDVLNGTDLFAILNYALFLEYLERDFYVRNVQRIFGV